MALIVPIYELCQISSVLMLTAPTPDLKGLMTALYHKVAHKWKMIGVYLEIRDLDSIETKHHGDSHLCLLEVLDTWLKRVDPLPTWSAIIEALLFLGENSSEGNLRRSICSPWSEFQLCHSICQHLVL